MSEINNTKNDLSELLQLVSFKIGKEEFGVDILKVQEIIKIISITKVPNSPHFVEGVINLRGRVIPIIDLRVRLGMEKKIHTNDTRIVVVELGGKIVGFIVDEVNEVLRISKSITEAPPELVTGVDSEYITAVGKLEDRMLILLDLDKVLNNEEKNQLTN
ncbi:MAG: purine-binding chemotaxis protein CheW [Ignavibacteriales bacterium]|nr:MAG: purine-binding chemotaxis protein CheW [Ignavibacteriales bacterium]